MRKVALVVVLASTLSTKVVADDTVLFGAGATTCAQYADYFRQAQNDDLLYSWAQGYMSAINTGMDFVGAKGTALNRWSTDRQRQFLRNYCDQHPLVAYFQAVEALLDSMRGDQGLPPIANAASWRL